MLSSQEKKPSENVLYLCWKSCVGFIYSYILKVTGCTFDNHIMPQLVIAKLSN